MCTLRTIYDTIAYRKKMDTAIRVSGGQESRLYFMKENNCKMTELPADELPYEKCINKGAEVLSDAELLAVILRTGSKGINALELSRKILDAGAPRNGLLGLYHMTIPQLCQIRGIGEVKAVQLKCIAELSRRIAGQSAWSALNFKDAASIADYFMEEMRHMEQEHVKLLVLNTKNVLIRDVDISKGTVNASLATPRELFIEALRYRGSSVILLHNHPSGDAAPSREDCLFTKRVEEAGKLIGIPLLDHIIIGDTSYVSLKERGIL